MRRGTNAAGLAAALVLALAGSGAIAQTGSDPLEQLLSNGTGGTAVLSQDLTVMVEPDGSDHFVLTATPPGGTPVAHRMESEGGITPEIEGWERRQYCGTGVVLVTLSFEPPPQADFHDPLLRTAALRRADMALLDTVDGGIGDIASGAGHGQVGKPASSHYAVECEGTAPRFVEARPAG